MTDFLNSLAKSFGFDNFQVFAADLGWNLAMAGLTVLGGWLVLKFVIARLIRAMERVDFPDATVRGVIHLLLRWVTILVTAYYVMLSLGVQTTAILGVATGSALAIGLAMQGTLSNVASGIMLLVLRPISVGHYIQGGGHEGTVVNLGIFYTTIKTIEKYQISIPNSTLFGSAIINMSANPVLTGRLAIGVSYDADLDQVKTLLVEAVKAIPGVRKSPEPQVLVQDLAASAINLEVRFDAARDDLWPTVRAARQEAKAVLDAHGIEIPFPQTTIHMRQPD